MLLYCEHLCDAILIVTSFLLSTLETTTQQNYRNAQPWLQAEHVGSWFGL